MNYASLFLERSDPKFRWSLHVLFAILAPVLAHSIHSFAVMHRDFRLYNAELWVLFVSERFHHWRAGVVIETLVQAGLTFLILWVVVEHPLRRWVVWLCCVALWTYLAFNQEIAIK